MIEQHTALLQHWLAEVITKPGTLQQKLHRAGHIYRLSEADVVAEEGSASTMARLNVYTTGYILRLLDCLSADFPVLQKFLGDEVFYGFAKASLVWSPPVSYTLYDLGKNFIAFLKSTRPPDSGQNPLLNLPIEIAKLERARQESLRSEGIEHKKTPLLSELSVMDILLQPHSINIAVPPCLRLLELKFPLKAFFEAINTDEKYDLPVAQKTYVAVSRKDYRITITELSEWQYLFLSACTCEPVNIMRIVDATVAANDITSSILMADLYVWLPLFLDNGIVTLD